MCGRFTQILSRVILELLYRIEVRGDWDFVPRYNLAPSQDAMVLRISPTNEARELVPLQWGLLPAWAKEGQALKKLINARAETVEQKPSFRSPFLLRRALVPANGYYEWKQVEGKKQPYLIRMEDGRPFSLAGLWERWEQGDEVRETFTIITTAAVGIAGEIHDRMPLILPEAAYDSWLCRQTPLPELRELLQLSHGADLVAHPVSTVVNNPRNDTPECIKPLA